jgi:daunorubicin resistance ABC transporter membrane protein
MAFLAPTLALWGRELVRFARQPSRIASAVGSPLLFWLLIGSGLSGSFRLPGGGGVSYLEYFFPGTVVLLVLFSSIFSTISIIEERQAGFLQGVLAAPVSADAVVAGKVLGGASLAWAQGAVLVLLAPLAGLRLAPGRGLAALAVLALLSVALTATGFACAWRVSSTQGFHGIMNLLLVPMWLLSGAFFPLAGVPGWLLGLAWIDPMTYGVAAFRRLLQPQVGALADPFPSLLVPVLATAAFAVLAWLLARAAVASRRVA